MKKQFQALSLLAVICAATVSTANAADGTINFVGEIIDSACTVSPASASQTVTLGTVSNKAFSAAGDTAAATPFQIDLTSCPATVTSAAVKFDGATSQGDNSALTLNPDAGAATGVAIQLRNEDNSVLPLFTNSQSISLVEDATNTLNFKAAYVATAATVTAGPANGVATFSVIYN